MKVNKSPILRDMIYGEYPACDMTNDELTGFIKGIIWGSEFAFHHPKDIGAMLSEINDFINYSIKKESRGEKP